MIKYQITSLNSSKSIGVLNRLTKHFLPEKIRIMLYDSLIHCLLAWVYEHSRIYKLQKKAIRVISVSKYNAHTEYTEPILKKLKLIIVEDILNMNELKIYYKFKNGLLPDYFNKAQEQVVNGKINKNCFTLNQNSQIHYHNTRHRDNLHISRTNHTFASKCLRHSIPFTVNSTPKNILDKINSEHQ